MVGGQSVQFWISTENKDLFNSNVFTCIWIDLATFIGNLEAVQMYWIVCMLIQLSLNLSWNFLEPSIKLWFPSQHSTKYSPCLSSLKSMVKFLSSVYILLFSISTCCYASFYFLFSSFNCSRYCRSSSKHWYKMISHHRCTKISNNC